MKNNYNETKFKLQPDEEVRMNKHTINNSVQPTYNKTFENTPTFENAQHVDLIEPNQKLIQSANAINQAVEQQITAKKLQPKDKHTEQKIDQNTFNESQFEQYSNETDCGRQRFSQLIKTPTRRHKKKKISTDMFNRDAIYYDGAKRVAIVYDQTGDCEVLNYPSTAKISDEK